MAVIVAGDSSMKSNAVTLAIDATSTDSREVDANPLADAVNVTVESDGTIN
jgi:hypothetical protein